MRGERAGWLIAAIALPFAILLAACASSAESSGGVPAPSGSVAVASPEAPASVPPAPSEEPAATPAAAPEQAATPTPAPTPTPEPNVWAATTGGLAQSVAGLPARVYVPNEGAGTVTVIDPATFGVVGTFGVGEIPQ